MRNLLNLGKPLNNAEQKEIFGGTGLAHADAAGWWACFCNEGHPVTSCPDGSKATCDFACKNLGGWTGTSSCTHHC